MNAILNEKALQMAKGDKKLETRQRIIDAASQNFRNHGFAGIGVDGIAKTAGVTSGAFYAHLGSKDAAFDIALRVGLDEAIQAIPVFQQEHGESWVEEFAGYYLGRAHREDLSNGCAMTTLSPEVVRSDPEVHSVYESKMKKIVGLIADGLIGDSREDCLSRAWALISVLIGGLTIARAVKTRKLADDIAVTICHSAVVAAGEVKSVPI